MDIVKLNINHVRTLFTGFESGILQAIGEMLLTLSLVLFRERAPSRLTC